MFDYCPKCQARQDGGEECHSCGIVFAKYKAIPSGMPPPSQPDPDPAPTSEGPSVFWKVFRIFRWTSLTLALLALVLIFKPSASPEVASDPQTPLRIQSKMRELQRNISNGDPHTLNLNESEINHYLGSMIELGPQETGPASESPLYDETLDSAEVQEIRSTIRDFKINLEEDQLSFYMVFDFHGKTMSMSMTTGLRVDSHYLRLEPSSGWLGSMPLPASVLQKAVDQLLESPENREKFRLPDHITEIHIEGRELKVRYDQRT